ncbi:DVU0524 family FlgM-associated protein [Desulfonatronospira sp.]|uniref:DVU0524 family FlgM-associated protein n=1 Tax=Desulfonatronospira sp. TaxID=1962951 RepID=UPI0025C4D269|nr:DVU0524 family FlgM-associated protein [Desulfonatronospira sp.]
MTINQSLLKNMFNNYDRQLVTGRKLSRLSRYLRGPDGDSLHPKSREKKRRAMVERVAREIVENLITSDSNNMIVQEIKEELRQEMNSDLIFHYPPTGEDMKVLKPGDDGPQELNIHEKDRILRKLWEITLDKVNRTML